MPLAATDLGPSAWLLFAGLGAVVGLDRTSWPQAMVSRPLVAGTLAGALLGSAEGGFVAGAVLELLSMPFLPMGAARTPDCGVAGLVGGGAYAAAGAGQPAGLVAAVLAGWAAGWVGAGSVALLREVGARHLLGSDEAVGDPDRLESGHRWWMRLDALRGAVVAGALLVPGALLTGAVARTGAAVGGVLPTAALAAVVAAGAGSAGRALAVGDRSWAFLVIGAAGTAAAALLA